MGKFSPVAMLMITLLAVPLIPGISEAGPFGKKTDMNAFRTTYKCRYDGYRKGGSVVRFSSDGDEKRVYFKIDSSWKMDAKQRLFKKTVKTGELTVDGKQYPERFINSIFDVDELILTREHGFVEDKKIDYISYYECVEVY